MPSSHAAQLGIDRREVPAELGRDLGAVAGGRLGRERRAGDGGGAQGAGDGDGHLHEDGAPTGGEVGTIARVSLVGSRRVNLGCDRMQRAGVERRRRRPSSNRRPASPRFTRAASASSLRSLFLEPRWPCPFARLPEPISATRSSSSTRTATSGPSPTARCSARRVARRAADPAQPITDVLFAGHGWQGDVPAAIVQFDRWITSMVGQQADRAAAQARPGGFAPLIVGLHWPSLPFGDEKPGGRRRRPLGRRAGAQPTATSTPGPSESPTRRRARAAIRTILQTARRRRPARRRPRRRCSTPTRRCSPSRACAARRVGRRAGRRPGRLRPEGDHRPEQRRRRASRRRSCSASATR